jgi:hypothetical protein
VKVKRPALLVAGEIRVSDEPEVGLEAPFGEGIREPHDAGGEATGPRVGIGPFEGEEVKLHERFSREIRLAAATRD